MMFATIDDLILARAAAMAEHNGGPVGAALIVGAAAQLQAEIITARDRLLVVPAGSAHVGAAAPEPEGAETPEVEAPQAPTGEDSEAPAPETDTPAAAPKAATPRKSEGVA